MDKEYFMSILKSRIGYLETEELNKHLSYYSQEIDNKINSGMDEYAAVKSLGPIIDIVKMIKGEIIVEEEKEEVIIEVEEPKEIVVEKVVKKDNKKLIIWTSPLWGTAAAIVALFTVCMYLASLTLFFYGMIMFFAAFTYITSPISTIMFGIGSGLGLFGLAIIFIPLSLFVSNFVVSKYKYYFSLLKEEFK